MCESRVSLNVCYDTVWISVALYVKGYKRCDLLLYFRFLGQALRQRWSGLEPPAPFRQSLSSYGLARAHKLMNHMSTAASSLSLLATIAEALGIHGTQALLRN